MKGIIILGMLFILSSCQNKEVQLPKADETIIADVRDHSPIYFFFKTELNDTLVEVNRKNTISSTNWLFNIDKRLPLRKVILEVKKLQTKKATSMHKSETSQNYFTYTNSTTRTLAFLPFTNVKYKVEVPDIGIFQVYFDRNDMVKLNDETFSKNDLKMFIDKVSPRRKRIVVFSFDKKMSFEQYIEDKILIKNLNLSSKTLNSHQVEYVY